MKDKLKNWRHQIDTLDEDLVSILAKRVTIVRKIGMYKKTRGLAPLDEKRWHAVLAAQISRAERHNLSVDFIKKLYDLIHKYSLEIETNNK